MKYWICIGAGLVVLVLSTVSVIRLGQRNEVFVPAEQESPFVQQEAAPDASPPWIAVEFSQSGDVLVTGKLPDQETRDRLESFAHEMHDPGSVRFLVEVDAATSSEPWLESHVLFLALAPFGQQRSNFDGEILTLEGEVGSQEDLQQINAESANAAAGAVQIVNLVRVRSAAT